MQLFPLYVARPVQVRSPNLLVFSLYLARFEIPDRRPTCVVRIAFAHSAPLPPFLGLWHNPPYSSVHVKSCFKTMSGIVSVLSGRHPWPLTFFSFDLYLLSISWLLYSLTCCTGSSSYECPLCCLCAFLFVAMSTSLSVCVLLLVTLPSLVSDF